MSSHETNVAIVTLGVDPVSLAAYNEYVSRKARLSHPDGEFDNAGRWYPSKSESCACCEGLRSPSRSYPYSLMFHCRTIQHVAARHGVDASTIRRAARALKNK